jgi:hypothetical protein
MWTGRESDSPDATTRFGNRDGRRQARALSPPETSR